MKKVLFASTALIASAGIAAAEVSLSGSAEMGVIGGDRVGNGEDAQFHTDIDVTFTMSGTTDNGLTFGASIDLDEGGNGEPFEDNEQQGGETIFISGAFGTLTMGDTDGALDWALTEAIIGASLNDDNEHDGYFDGAGLDGSTNGATGDGQIARYDYSFGDFAVAVSAEIDTDIGAADDGDVYGIGLRYSTEFSGVDLGFGLGYQANDDVSLVGASVSAEFASGLQAILEYTDFDSDVAGADVTHYGVAVGYSFDAILVAVNYGQYDFEAGGDVDGFGVIVNYDLGGGAELQAGYGQSTDAAGVDSDQWSFGVAMSF